MQIETKIIFLDIDGVLNVYPQGRDEFGSIFHKHFIDNLKYIIEQTGAKLVISSTWRHSGFQYINDMWEFRKLPGDVIGRTPDLYDPSTGSIERGYEIQRYIDLFDVKTYCIIDDDADMLESQMNNFVQTSENQDHPDCVDIGYGLTKICAEKVVTILNR
tara:strand:- start:735 stop:1214 length:480 start_codon:yes stop_codon:yes gene_type:complete